MALKKWVPSQLWASFMNDYNTNIDELIATTESHNLALADTGWQTANLAESNLFKAYSGVAANTPEYRKIGSIVHIRGAVSPKNAIPYSTTSYHIFTLPEGFRPNKGEQFVCHGSEANKWLLTVFSDGQVYFARHGGTGQVATTSAWLPLAVTYFVS